MSQITFENLLVHLQLVYILHMYIHTYINNLIIRFDLGLDLFFSSISFKSRIGQSLVKVEIKSRIMLLNGEPLIL